MLKETTLRSQDLNCPSCVGKIERALSRTNGVKRAKVHFGTGRIVVEHDQRFVDEADLIDVIGNVGYSAKVTAF